MGMSPWVYTPGQFIIDGIEIQHDRWRFLWEAIPNEPVMDSFAFHFPIYFCSTEWECDDIVHSLHVSKLTITHSPAGDLVYSFDTTPPANT